ncbi:MAG: hypothetical protein DWP94_00870 [Flavobacterium sp.]|nr:MAG: hypothetical protein DWP94_00870 [Flavobacterium sp.]
MSEFQKKIEDIETKDRRSKIYYVIALGLTLLIFALIYWAYSRETKVVADTRQEVVKKDMVVNKLDSIKKTDSIKKREINVETVQIRNLLDTLKSTTSDKEVLRIIKDLENKMIAIDGFSSDSTIVRYYKRKADGDAIEKAIRELNPKGYKLNIKEPTTNLNARSNTLYYGNKVKPERKDEVLKKLRSKGVKIEKVLPFYMGYKWKDEALEIGYDYQDPKKLKVNSQYTVRVNSWRENDEEAKSLIKNFLKYHGYNAVAVKTPKNRPRAFSKTPTLHYFDKNLKKVAKEIQLAIKNGMNIELEVQYTPVTDRKGGDFSIHYEGNF